MVHPLDAPTLSRLLPLLEACNQNIGRCGELRLAAHLIGRNRPDWEARLRWLGWLPKLEKEVGLRLKEARDNDEASSHQILAMFAATWEATESFPETREELTNRIGSRGRPR